ncbi:MAG: hypothetical protein ICV60_11465 [Pyrinomonadaceae bacterium]|nr:hypothetical protein [Pyrinomonadaceae bacterium]
MVEKGSKNFVPEEKGLSMMRFIVMLALALSAFVATSEAQQTARRITPSLTSEDLLDRPSPYKPAVSPAPVSSSSISSASRLSSAGAALYRDPAGAFSLSLPSGNWQLNTKSLAKGKLWNLRVFRKLDADGFASATASIYVLSSTGSPLVSRLLQADGSAQRSLAESLVTRFLSSSAEIVSVNAGESGIQVVADQLVSRRAVVRASISAFEHGGKLYVVVCRAPLETFDAQAREFSAITQSLAVSVARSS